jgi:hypothetical protein
MKKIAVLSVLLQTCGLAAAQSGLSTGIGAQGTTFICGGIGLDEQQRIKALASHHDLMLTFAVSTGEYLADVDVRIHDSRGATVLDTRCDGPIMLVNLPAGGSYRVTAEVNGQLRQATVTTGKGVARAVFLWPAGTS